MRRILITRTLPFLFLIFSFGQVKLFCQDSAIVGKWSIKTIEKCILEVRPGAIVEKTLLDNKHGTIIFHNNGEGKVDPSGLLLCKKSTFFWIQIADTLIISEDSSGLQFKMKVIKEIADAEGYFAKVTFFNNSIIKITEVPGCNRFGCNIWYDVELEKLDDKIAPNQPSNYYSIVGNWTVIDLTACIYKIKADSVIEKMNLPFKSSTLNFGPDGQGEIISSMNPFFSMPSTFVWEIHSDTLFIAETKIILTSKIKQIKENPKRLRDFSTVIFNGRDWLEIQRFPSSYDIHPPIWYDILLIKSMNQDAPNKPAPSR